MLAMLYNQAPLLVLNTAMITSSKKNPQIHYVVTLNPLFHLASTSHHSMFCVCVFAHTTYLIKVDS